MQGRESRRKSKGCVGEKEGERWARKEKWQEIIKDGGQGI